MRDDTFYICPDGYVTMDINEVFDHGNGYTIRYVFTACCTAGGSRQFDTRDEAEAYAAEKSPTWSMGTKAVTVWRTSDGQEFGDESAAADYCASKALDVYKVTQSEWYYETVDGKQFDDSASASDWAVRVAPTMAGTPTSTRTVWGTDADDQTFLTREEADRHAKEASPYAIGQRKQRVVWKTSDGQTFDSEEAAEVHGQTLCLTVSKGSRDVVTWHCVGKSFSAKADADAYSRSLVPVVRGTRQESGWVTSDGKWFATEDEAAAWAHEQNDKGEWRHDGRGWWFVNDAGGYPAGGWDEIGGDWYLFDGSGYMLTGWQLAGGRWYWLGMDGAMKTGWQCVNGSWYWLGGLGDGAMRTGWAEIDGAWYWLDASGAMATSQWIDGRWWVGADGKWVG